MDDDLDFDFEGSLPQTAPAYAGQANGQVEHCHALPSIQRVPVIVKHVYYVVCAVHFNIALKRLCAAVGTSCSTFHTRERQHRAELGQFQEKLPTGE